VQVCALQVCRGEECGSVFDAFPAGMGAAELQGGPELEVELEGDDLGLAIEAEGAEPHSPAVRTPAHRGEEGVEVAGGFSVDRDDAPGRAQPVAIRRRAIPEPRHVEALRGNASLHRDGAVGCLQQRTRP